ncbi:MAG: cobalamin biosynthesis protein [Succinivibrio sp.]|nr:cobalamin biosynthesis protein [Succinivibrio sp.]
MLDEFINGITSVNVQPEQVGTVSLQLLELPGVILMFAMLLEFLLPIPDEVRLSRLSPLFKLMAAKVNRPDNTAAHSYLAGILLPFLIIFLCLLLMLIFASVAGFDSWLGLVVLPLILESRLCMHLSEETATLLHNGQNEETKALLKPFTIRQVDRLSRMGLAKTCTEIVIQRMFVTWFAVLVWYMIAGLPGALVMQLSSIMSRSFSTKYPQNKHFGTCITRIEHGMLLFPAAILGLCSLVSFFPLRAIRAGMLCAAEYPSPVSGFVLGLLGYKLNISLGGPRYYHGEIIRFPRIGGAADPNIDSAQRAFNRLRWYGIIFVCLCILVEALTTI